MAAAAPATRLHIFDASNAQWHRGAADSGVSAPPAAVTAQPVRKQPARRPPTMRAAARSGPPKFRVFFEAAALCEDECWSEQMMSLAHNIYPQRGIRFLKYTGGPRPSERAQGGGAAPASPNRVGTIGSVQGRGTAATFPGTMVVGKLVCAMAKVKGQEQFVEIPADPALALIVAKAFLQTQCALVTPTDRVQSGIEAARRAPKDAMAALPSSWTHIRTAGQRQLLISNFVMKESARLSLGSESRRSLSSLLNMGVLSGHLDERNITVVHGGITEVSGIEMNPLSHLWVFTFENLPIDPFTTFAAVITRRPARRAPPAAKRLREGDDEDAADEPAAKRAKAGEDDDLPMPPDADDLDAADTSADTVTEAPPAKIKKAAPAAVFTAALEGAETALADAARAIAIARRAAPFALPTAAEAAAFPSGFDRRVLAPRIAAITAAVHACIATVGLATRPDRITATADKAGELARVWAAANPAEAAYACIPEGYQKILRLGCECDVKDGPHDEFIAKIIAAAAAEATDEKIAPSLIRNAEKHATAAYTRAVRRLTDSFNDARSPAFLDLGVSEHLAPQNTWSLFPSPPPRFETPTSIAGGASCRPAALHKRWISYLLSIGVGDGDDAQKGDSDDD